MKIFITFCYLTLFLISVRAEAIDNTAIKYYVEYFHEVFEMLMHDLKDLGLCNLRMKDFTHSISKVLYGEEVIGTLRYFNGFVIGLSAANIGPLDITSSLDNTTMTANVRGRFNLKGLRFAYDLDAQLTTINQKTTGIYMMDTIGFNTLITKNLKSGEITAIVQHQDISSSFGKQRIQFLPKNFYTTIIAKEFNNNEVKAEITEGIAKWTDVLNPIFKKIAQEKIKFPDIEYDTAAKGRTRQI